MCVCRLIVALGLRRSPWSGPRAGVGIKTRASVIRKPGRASIRSAAAWFAACVFFLAALSLTGATLAHAQADATLSTLELTDSNGNAITLDPRTFNAATTTYTAQVTHATATVTVTATSTEMSASVTYTPTDTDMASGHQVALPPGQTTTITVRVTSGNGLVIQDYTLDVKRLATDVCERTMQVRNGIVAAVSGVSDCADLTPTQLAAIADLNLSLTRLSSLVVGDFAGLTGLQTLTANGNSLSTLPVNVFAGLSALQELTFRGNGTTSLPVGAFNGLTNLQKLDLQVNAMTTLPVGVFSGLAKLRDLFLNNNVFNSLPVGIFGGLTELQKLYIESNKLTTLPSGLFSGLTKLTRLRLGSNPLTSLPSDLFNGLSALERLDLDYTELTTLPSGLFGGLSALTFFSMVGTPLTTIPAGLFDVLTALTSLQLSHNQLASLPNNIFQPLTELISLGLQGNPGVFAPAAIPGDSQEVVSGVEVMLNGSTGESPWGTNVSYAWEQTEGVTVTLIDDDTAAPTFIAPADKCGLVFTLTVTAGSKRMMDNGIGGYYTDSDTVTITTVENVAPTLEERCMSGDCRDLTSGGPNCGIGSSIDRRPEGYREQGAIQSASDGDLWSVIFERGGTYEIEVKGAGDPGGDNGGTLTDPKVEIYEMSWDERRGWSGTKRASNDDVNGANKNARVTYTYPYVKDEPQTLIGIRVSGTSGSTGSYTVTVVNLSVEKIETAAESTDCTADTTTTCSLDVPGIATGEIATATDNDYWKVTLKAGKVYEIDLEGSETGQGTLEDPIMYLLDSAETELAEADDVEDKNYNARLIYFIPSGKGGTHFITVNGVSGDTGTYTLTVREHELPEPLTETSDCASGSTSTCTMDVGDRVTGRLQNDQDTFDTWKVTLVANKTYRIAIESLGAVGPPEIEAFLYTEMGTNSLAYSYPGTPVTYTVPGDGGGVYRVDVRETDDQTGLYALTVTDITPSGQQSLREEVPPPATPLTAAFGKVPAEHDGSSTFDLELHFSEAPKGLSYRTLRGNAFFNITNGTVTKAKRLKRKDNSGWRITVEPASSGDVTLGLLPALPTADCAEATVVCTADGTRLSVGPATFVPGPATLSVADTSVQEAPNATLDFVVTLDRARHETTTVAYATSDGTATAGADYTAESGTLTFAIGETEQTVSVPVLDDAIDDDGETVTLTLSTASAPTRITRATATGTIENADPLPQAWLARFGRTVGTHVVDAVGERLRGAPGQDSHLTIGGQRLPLGTRGAATGTPDGAAEGGSGVARLVQALGQRLGLSPGPASAGSGNTGTDPWAAQPGTDPRLGQSRTLAIGKAFTLRQILLGSSFRLAFGAADADSSHPRLTAWGRFAGTRFDGQDGDLTLDGDVFTGTVGVDGEWDRVLAGVAVAHSRGEGGYTMSGLDARGRGDLENTLTSIHPYLRYAVTDRLAVWGLLGYGWGELELAQGTGGTLETDTTLVMGAVGGRGILLAAADSGGFQLATRTDAMLTRTSSDAVTGMQSSDADAHRLRLVLEGSRAITWAQGRSLTPTLELGVRHDWGDAETGFGVEVGGRIRYADPTLGLTIEGTVRGLLAHEDAAYEEWGASGNIRLAPGPGGQGLALTLAPTWGAAASGVDGLWTRQTTAGLAPTTSRAQTGQLSAEVGYGVPAPFGTGLLTPYAGTVLTEGAARTYRLGTRLQLTGGPATGLTLNLEGTRQDPAGPQPVNQGLRLQATWAF